MFLFKPKTPQPRFRYGSVFYVLVLLAFAIVSLYYPVIGLIVLGSLLLIAGIFAEISADRIWQDSQKWYKKNRKHVPWYNRPTPLFYSVNVYIIWPLVILMGIFALVTAYKLVGIVG